MYCSNVNNRIYYSTHIIYEHVLVGKHRSWNIILFYSYVYKRRLNWSRNITGWMEYWITIIGLEWFPLTSQCTSIANKEVFSSEYNRRVCFKYHFVVICCFSTIFWIIKHVDYISKVFELTASTSVRYCDDFTLTNYWQGLCTNLTIMVIF